jgi:peptide deformylase
MVMEIVDAKDPNLRKKSKPVKKIDKKIKSLIQEMKKTLITQNDPEGVGLAAPQVGKNIRLFLMKPDKDIIVVINPKVISKSKEKTKQNKEPLMEGCLSLPHFYSPIDRYTKITIQYQDENGKIQKKSFQGYEAQIVQHEIDHLNGVIFVDKVLKQKKPLYEYINGEWEEVDLVI